MPWWDANVTPEAVEAFDTIKARWEALLAKLGNDPARLKACGIGPQLEHWRAVNDTILPTIATLNETELSGLSHDIATAESNAARCGYTAPGQAPAPTPKAAAQVIVKPVATPSVEQAHPIASAIDQAAPSLPGAPRTGGLGWWESIPTGAKVGGAIAGALVLTVGTLAVVDRVFPSRR